MHKPDTMPHITPDRRYYMPSDMIREELESMRVGLRVIDRCPALTDADRALRRARVMAKADGLGVELAVRI